MTIGLTPEATAKLDALVGNLTIAPGRQTTALGRGLAKALTRAAVSARVAMWKAVADDLGVRQVDIKKYIKSKDATADKLESRVYAWGKKGVALIDLQATGPEPSRGKGGGVRVKADPSRYPHAFIATMPRSGHRGVFERQAGKFMRSNPKRQAIQELRTTPIPKVFARNRDVGIARASAALSTNLVSEVSYALHGGA